MIAGIFLLADGILELASSFMTSTRNRGMVALFGAITAIVGVLLIRHPIGGVAAVALLIGLWLIVIGVIRLATAFDEYEHRGWHAFAGALELIAGIVIVANPNIGFATLTILAGIGFIVNGVGLVASAGVCAGSGGRPQARPKRTRSRREAAPHGAWRQPGPGRRKTERASSLRHRVARLNGVDAGDRPGALLGVAPVSRLRAGTPITPAMVFSAFGLLVGPKVLAAAATVGRLSPGETFDTQLMPNPGSGTV